MSIGLVQDINFQAATSGTTIGGAVTWTQGSCAHIIMGYNDQTLAITNLSDGVNTFTKQNSDRVAGGIRVVHFTAQNLFGGSVTLTGTYPASGTTRFLIIREFSGCIAVPVDGVNTATQATPGTGTDGVTISATATGSAGVISAFFNRTFFNATAVAGTGFTSGQGETTGTAGQGGWRTEHKIFTSGFAGSNAATFTVGNNGTVISVMAGFDASQLFPVGQIIT